MTCVGIALLITNKKNLINFLYVNVWKQVSTVYNFENPQFPNCILMLVYFLLFYFQVNPYYYEVYLVILDILAKSDYEGSEQLLQQNSILHFLKSYNRIR